IGVIAGETAPSNIDCVDAGGAGTPVGPADELLDFFLVALREQFDAAVCAVFDPSREPKPACLALRRCPEEDTLYPAAHVKMHLLQRHLSAHAKVHGTRTYLADPLAVQAGTPTCGPQRRGSGRARL